MSHFSTIKTQLVEKEYLIKALRDLGYAPEDGDVDVLGYAGNRMRADIKIPTKNPDYDIGFRQMGEVFECVADWHGIRGIQSAQFLQQVTQRYAYHAAKAKLQEQGFAVASEETQKDGRIHLVLRKLT